MAPLHTLLSQGQQFGGQEPGTADEIATFCAINYGVTFPVFAKIEFNGPRRHPLYAELTAVAVAAGSAGDVDAKITTWSTNS